MSRAALYTFFAIVFIKGLVLLVDSQPAYFFGDSESYLATATAKYIPADRSFLYGLLLRKIALPAHSLKLIIALQVVFSALAAWLLSFLLRKFFSVRWMLAGVFGVLCAIEPLQLLAERYVLTETCATFLFAVHFALILFYIRRGRLWTLLLAQFVGVLLIGFRISFLPLVLIDSVLIPLLSPQAIGVFRRLKQHRETGEAWVWRSQMGSVALSLVMSLLVSQGFLVVYKRWYGKLIRREPAIFYNQGAFLVADFAPLIEPEDFPVAAKRQAIFGNLIYDRHDPLTRPIQHFVPGGLWPTISKEFPDDQQANDLAVATAVHALLRQPFGAVRLQIATFLQYFDKRSLHEWLVVDEGGNGSVMSPVTRGWLQDVYHVSDTRDYQMSLTKQWHQLVPFWYWIILCSLVLLPLLFAVRPRSEYPFLIVSTVSAWLLFTSATLTVDRPTPRFLTSAAWLTLFLIGVAFSRQRVTRDSHAFEQAVVATSSHAR
jgi:hypothetical protein